MDVLISKHHGRTNRIVLDVRSIEELLIGIQITCMSGNQRITTQESFDTVGSAIFSVYLTQNERERIKEEPKFIPERYIDNFWEKSREAAR